MPEFNSKQRVHNKEQMDVLIAMAAQHEAAEVSAHNGIVEAWFEDEDTCNKFECEADVYAEQQEFLDTLDDDSAAELGLQF